MRDLVDKTVECQILLEYKADINQVNDDGWTALHLAARYADARIVKVGWLTLLLRLTETVDCQILLEHGADVKRIRNKGWTALHYAARYSNVEMVKVGRAFTSFLRLTETVGC